jgi:ABC-type transport system substrate-binding protein
MRDKTIVMVSLLVALLMLSFAAVPVLAFVHPDGSEDSKFELFGPRIDRILVKKYATLESEIAALQGGEIDITDWALTKTLVDTLTTDPNVRVLGYGGEAGYYTLSMNTNNNTYLGNPPDPTFPNPVLPNPTSDVYFRQAISHMINNTALVLGPGQGLFDAIYTPIPAYMAFWVHPQIAPGGLYEDLTYPFSYTDAATILNSHWFPVGPDTFRYWDLNHNGVKDAGEAISVSAYTRADALRRGAGDQLQAGLDALKIPYTRQEVTSAQARQICMIEKNYNFYTSGWIFIGPDPDYLYDLYSWDNYYHDGIANPPNIAAIGKYDPLQEGYLKGIKYASDIPTALAAALNFQFRFAQMAYEKPLASTSAPKAYNKWYTGGNDGVILGTDDGENQYRHDTWDQIVNQKGQGENSWWSTLAMFPTGHPLGDGTHMTVRYGWQQNDMPAVVNPMYSSWYWESELWGRSIDGMGARNPYTLGPVEVPQLADSFTLGTWVDPADGVTKSSVTIHMRCGVRWNDGQPATIDDFLYTLAVMPFELRAKGCTDVWWQPILDQVAGYYKLDDYTGQVLMKVNTYLAQSWIVGVACVPKHFWQPYIAANAPEVIQGDIAPGNLIGTGPFLYVENVPAVSATLVRNPLYFSKDPLWIVPSYTATGASVQISPNKIKPNGNGFGNGTFNVVITDYNLDVYAATSYTKSVTIQKVLPAPAGPVITLSATHPVTTIAGGSDVETFAVNFAKGEYEIIVTKTITSGPYTGHVVTQNSHVKVTVAGDLNGDWKVNILDITPIAIRFGAVRGDANSPPLPKYDAVADLNHDGKINILDIVQVALVFGWDP